ncbi:uncharacterized protein [Bactrocera oleae]|uniref:uncharacterized protein n=1 Tax=Bactrocera oleae TaxID=104688 RepID=UPI00387EBFC8
MLSSTIYAAPASDELTADVTFIMPKPRKKRRKRRKRCATTVPTISSTTSTSITRATDNTLSVATVSSSTSPCKSIATRRRATNKVRRYFQHDTREIVKTITESELNYAAVAKKFKPLTIATNNKNQTQKQKAKRNTTKQSWHKQQLKTTKCQAQKPKMFSKSMVKSSPHFCSTTTTAKSTHSFCKCACAFATAATSHAKYKQQKTNNCDSMTFDNKTNVREQQQAAVVESAMIVEELLRKLLNAQHNNANAVTSQSPMLNLLQNTGITTATAPRMSLLDTLIGEQFQQTTSLCQQQLRHVVRYIVKFVYIHPVYTYVYSVNNSTLYYLKNINDKLN